MIEDSAATAAAEMVERELTNFERLAEHLGQGSLACALLNAWNKEKSLATLHAAIKTFTEQTNAQRSA